MAGLAEGEWAAFLLMAYDLAFMSRMASLDSRAGGFDLPNSMLITIYKNDGRWDRSHARLCLIHPSTTMRDIREQLSSEKKAIDDEDGVTLILRGGTPVDPTFAYSATEMK